MRPSPALPLTSTPALAAFPLTVSGPSRIMARTISFTHVLFAPRLKAAVSSSPKVPKRKRRPLRGFARSASEPVTTMRAAL